MRVLILGGDGYLGWTIQNDLEMQIGDVQGTRAAATLLTRQTGYRPQIDIRSCIARFTSWFCEYHGK